eukprot:6485383-Amphidinium_carterae.2
MPPHVAQLSQQLPLDQLCLSTVAVSSAKDAAQDCPQGLAGNQELPLPKLIALPPALIPQIEGIVALYNKRSACPDKGTATLWCSRSCDFEEDDALKSDSFAK